MKISQRVKKRLTILSLVLSTLLTLLSVLEMRQRARAVDLLLLFASGVGVGASITSTVYDLKTSAK